MDYNIYYKDRYINTYHFDELPIYIYCNEINISGYTSKDILYTIDKEVKYVVSKVKGKSIYIETYDVWLQEQREQKINELLK